MRSSSRILYWIAGATVGIALMLVVVSGAGASCLSFTCEGSSYDGSTGSFGTGGNTTLGIAIGSPSTGATVSGTVSVTAKISGQKQNNVNRIEFFFDGILYDTETKSPWKGTWNTLDATYPAYDGVHQLTAVGYDGNGWAASSPISVTVANTAGTKYRATFSSPDVPQTVSYDPSAGTQPTQPVNVTLTNTSSISWSASSVRLYYRWSSPDPTPNVTSTAAPVFTSNVSPGASRTVTVQVTPPTLDDGIDRAQYRLRFDLAETGLAGTTWFADAGNQPLENPVIVNKLLKAEALGLEPYYMYVTDPVGAGMTHRVNVANGNSLLSWTPMQTIGRGLSTVVDLTYNSLEKKTESPVGNNFSLGVSTLMRLGLPLDIHPNNADTNCPNTTSCWIAFTDIDGTRHKFVGHTATDGTIWWEETAGTHLYLRVYSTSDATKRWAITRPDGVTYLFDAQGYPTSVFDRNGNTITFTLQSVSAVDDPGGVKERITKVTDAGGRSFSLAYFTKSEVKKPELRGKLKSITDPLAHMLSFDYYGDGNLRKITQSGGANLDGTFVPARSFVFTYTTSDGSGPAISNPSLRVDPDPATSNESTRLYSVRDPLGHETIFAYNGPGSSIDRWKLQTTTDRGGAVWNYGYDNANRVTTVTAPLSRRTTYAYNTGGQVTSISDPLGRVTTQEWSSDLQLTKVTEPNGGVTAYTYNDNGLATDQTDARGNHTAYAYANSAADNNDASGKWTSGRTIPHISDLASATTPRGNTTRYTIDTHGNVTAVTDPTAAVTARAYNSDGTVSTVTDPNGNVFTYSNYDPSGQVTRAVDPLSGVEQRGYDLDGNLIWIQDPLHASETATDTRNYRSYFDYDAFGRQERTTTPKSTSQARGTLIVSRTDYDGNNNVIATYQPGYGAPGPQTTQGYDAMDDLTRMTLPNGEQTQYVYDTAGRLAQLIDPIGVQKASTDPNEYRTFYSYDAADQLTKTTRYVFDASGSLQTLNTFDCYTVGGDLRWDVGPRANLSSVDCSASTPPPLANQYTYDLAHQELSLTDAEGRTTSTTYDADQNTATETDENGNVSTNVYNQRDDLVKEIQPVDTTATPPRYATRVFQYDPAGNLTKDVSPRGYDASPDKTTFTEYATTYQYDTLGRLIRTDLPTSATDATQYYIHQRYDADGNLTLYTLPATSPDPNGVLQVRKNTLTYLDPGWIQTSKTPHLPLVHYDYASDSQQTSRILDDPNGNPDTVHAELWTYNADGQLQSMVDRAGRTTSFIYDADGNVITEAPASVPAGNGITISSVYDGLDRPVDVRTRSEASSSSLDSSFSYDQDNNVIHRELNRVLDSSGNTVSDGRKADLMWNGDNELTQLTDSGWSAGSSARITDTYWPTGEVKTATLERPAGTGWATDASSAYTYNADYSLASATTKNGAGAVVESHTPSYLDPSGQYVNGNVTRDTFTLVGPSNTQCRASSCTASYTYDPRERLVHDQTVRNGTTRTTNYTVDGAGNVNVLDAGGDQTTFSYDGDRLVSRTHGTDTRYYSYDWFGNVNCVTRTTPPDCTTSAPNLVAKYTYDGVDRLKAVRTYNSDGTSDRTTDYTYDVLNRATQETEAHGTDSPRTTAFAYLGATDLTNSEQASGSSGVLSTKGYSYGTDGTPFDLTITPAGGTASRYDYEYDTHGSASLLLSSSGDAAASYGYTPYGAGDGELNSVDVNSNDPMNAVRYTGNRYDSGSSNLAMGARQFSPDDMHFLQEDQFSQAGGDSGLTQSPPDQNRYGLAGGNPVNFRDEGGHMVSPDGGGGGAPRCGVLSGSWSLPYAPLTTSSKIYLGIDQGVDWNPSRNVKAIAPGIFYWHSGTNHWVGHGAIYEHLDHGVCINNRKYRNVYYAEEWALQYIVPLKKRYEKEGSPISVHVKAGQAVMQPGGNELGFATASHCFPAPSGTCSTTQIGTYVPCPARDGCNTEPTRTGCDFYDLLYKIQHYLNRRLPGAPPSKCFWRIKP